MIDVKILEQTVRSGVANDPVIAYALELAKKPLPIVEDAISLANAATMLTALKQGAAQVETLRKTYAQPLTEASRSVNETAKEFSAPLVVAYSAIDKEMTRWRNAEEALAAVARVEVQKHAEATAEPGLPPVSTYVAPPPAVVETPHGRAVFTRRWTFKVLDVAKVPRQFWRDDPIDSAKVMQAFRAGIRNIPGIHFYEEDQVGRRR